ATSSASPAVRPRSARKRETPRPFVVGPARVRATSTGVVVTPGIIRGGPLGSPTVASAPHGHPREFRVTLNIRMSWEMIRNLVRDEWLILSLLLAWSLAGLTVICERLYALWNLIPKSDAFKNRVLDALESGDTGKAAALCEMSQVPLAE